VFRYRGLIFQTPAMGFIMPTPWPDRPFFEFFGVHFFLNAQRLAADLGAALGACFAGSLLWPSLAHKCALDDLQRRPTSVTSIGAQVLAAPHAWRLALDHDGLQHGIELRVVMLIGLGHDERQGDATPVHQQVALAAFFFPDLSGWARHLLAPSAP